jgi:hypothetical protein
MGERYKESTNFWLGILVATALLLGALVLAFWRESKNPVPVSLIPKLTGEEEYCLTCHADLPEISPSHPVETFGCVVCHGGERLALDADLAHSSMRGGANPSDLTVVEESCGGNDCHLGSMTAERDHIQRVMTSIQGTYAGAIANIRFTFGAQNDLTPIYGIYAVEDASLPTKTGILALAPFDPLQENNHSIQQFGEKCLTCHITGVPREGKKYKRQTGCAACHSPLPIDEDTTTVHRLTTAIPYKQCNTCHNRGNYDLRKMTFVERSDDPHGRFQDYYQPIAQFTQCEYTLDCIDCHTRVEVMGDGDIHPDMSDIQYIRCKTCHGTLTALPDSRILTDPNDIAFRLSQVNPVVKLELGDTILVTEKGEPLWNTRVLSDGTFELVGKATHQQFIFHPVMGSNCKQDPEKQESRYCHECHAVER